MESALPDAKIQACRLRPVPPPAWINRAWVRCFAVVRHSLPESCSGAFHGEQQFPATRQAGLAYSMVRVILALPAHCKDWLRPHSARGTTSAPGQMTIAVADHRVEQAAEEECSSWWP